MAALMSVVAMPTRHRADLQVWRPVQREDDAAAMKDVYGGSAPDCAIVTTEANELGQTGRLPRGDATGLPLTRPRSFIELPVAAP
jgi:hypothetical protein